MYSITFLIIVNKNDRKKRSIRRKLREFNIDKDYFNFTDEVKYHVDIYEAEKKFIGKRFRRTKSQNNLKTKYILDARNTFVSLPGFKDLLKEVKLIEEKEKEKSNVLPEGYEFKNLRKISTFEINQRV